MLDRVRIRGIAFDMYGTLVDVGAVAKACRAVTPDPVAFNTEWRAKQLEYAFLRGLMEEFQDFCEVTRQALDFTLKRNGIEASAEQKATMMEAWMHPMAYPDVAPALERLGRYNLAVLSNGSRKMLERGLERTGLARYFRHVLSVDVVHTFKPSPKVYAMAPQAFGCDRGGVLFVSSNSWDVIGAKAFGLQVCWLNRKNAILDPLGPKPDLTLTTFTSLTDTLT
ncbi:MAG: haloacid dehalogenase type II [Candidatus Methylomirabilales bacterium]